MRLGWLGVLLLCSRTTAASEQASMRAATRCTRPLPAERRLALARPGIQSSPKPCILPG